MAIPIPISKADQIIRQNAFVSNRVLFEYAFYGSVLNGGVAASVTRGIASGHRSLLLRTGYNISTDTLKAPFRVEILRPNDYQWHILENIPEDTTAGAKEFIFPLVDADDDYVGYRLVANGRTSVY